jgi:hypothetical protein
MAANVEIQSDTGYALTSYNFGAINGGALQEHKFRVQNVGNNPATNVQLFLQRLASNDGLDYATLAEDASGNPGTYSRNAIIIGDLAPGQLRYFWAKVTVPSGTTPAGNPRQFDVVVQYTGT